MKKLYWLLIIALLVGVGFMAFTSSQSETLGTFVVDSCIELKQTCSNCTYVNITRVSSPNSTVILSGNFFMTKTDTVYNRTFCQTSEVGEYIVDWKADPDAEVKAGNYNFFISLTGTRPTTAQGTIYFFLGILSIAIFIFSLFFAIKIPWDHRRNERGIIVSLNDLRYVKLFLWFFTYLMAIFIVFAFEHVAKMGDWLLASNWLNFIFWGLVGFLLPVFVITVTSFIIAIVDAKKMDALIRRGFKVR